MNYFFEKLRYFDSIKICVRAILDKIVSQAGQAGIETIECFFIDSSPINPNYLIKKTMSLFGIKKLDFTYSEIRDDSGILIGLKIIYFDLQKVLDFILTDKKYDYLFKEDVFKSPHFFLYIKKDITNTVLAHDGIIEPCSLTLLKINVCKQSAKKQQASIHKKNIFFMENRLWKEAISQYAKDTGIDLVWAMKKFSLSRYIRKKLYDNPRIRHRLKHMAMRRKGMLIHNDFKSTVPLISIENFGHINLFKKELFSELSFFTQSKLCHKNLLLYSKHAPLSSEQKEELKSTGIAFISLNPNAEKKNDVLIYSPRLKNNFEPSNIDYKSTEKKEGIYLQTQKKKYDFLKNYWFDFFSKTNSKIHVTPSRWDNQHIPITDALKELGGISTLWQIAYFDLASPVNSVSADILFSFSLDNDLVEKKQGSIIKYHVATGYLQDYRFHLIKPMAENIRKKLCANGAKKIISFFDENSSSEDRWSFGNSFACKQYAFLLEKLLENPWLGVVFKPKKPQTLRTRLHNINELIEKAIATGRCHFGVEDVYGLPPALGALASDVAVHGNMAAGTAGLEAALCGVPTLFLDYENWEYSRLNRLGKDTVVFNEWESLWRSLLEHWNSKVGITGFGNWKPLLNQLDPFQDGKAAERMGTYLSWLIQGYEQGLKKETILSDAADRYCKRWGQDKISIW